MSRETTFARKKKKLCNEKEKTKQRLAKCGNFCCMWEFMDSFGLVHGNRSLRNINDQNDGDRSLILENLNGAFQILTLENWKKNW